MSNNKKISIEELIDRINSFSLLPQDWYDENSQKITNTSINVAKKILRDYVYEKYNNGGIYVFPITYGGLQFEIYFENQYIEISILDNKVETLILEAKTYNTIEEKTEYIEMEFDIK